MIRVASAAISVAIAAVLLKGADEGPKVYRNDEFRITLPIPPQTLPCFEPKEHHDHGPVLLLGTTDAGVCEDRERIASSRYIAIFAGYNAVDDTKVLHRLLQWECSSSAKQRCQSAPPGLTIPGVRTAAGKVGGPNGWIEIIVVAQAGKPDPSFDPTVPSINYEITLHTRRQNLEGDVRVLRTIVRTVQISQ